MLILGLMLITQVTASKVIECIFPCQNSAELCTITQSTIHCTAATEDQWILKSSNSLPTYQGTLSQIGQACQPIPLPNLRDATHLSTNTSETVIDWPPTNEDHPLDKYFGNCDDTSFCNVQTSVCVGRYGQGHYCDSTNQCSSGHHCVDSTCEFASSAAHKESRGLETVHIVVAVLGVLLVVGILVCIYLIRRRRNRKLETTNNDDSEQQKNNNIINNNNNNSHIRTPSTSSSSQPSSHHVTTMLAYEDHFQNTPSPSMQQQTLQYELQRQLQNEVKTSPPPPPYSP